MHVISPSHVPPNQDRQGKIVQGIIFIRVQEPKRVLDIKVLFAPLTPRARLSRQAMLREPMECEVEARLARWQRGGGDQRNTGQKKPEEPAKRTPTFWRSPAPSYR